ncbi:uncharacterized protein [Phyllobates terribilis]|uniref:uncharacterized protein n=1 Tax=Phyllobates terribilis TaxID=111132 RepID=UPI003CCA8BFB
MEFVRNMERRRLIKPQDILATLQSIPEDESESELQEHVFDSDSDEDFIPQNISSESEDSEGTNPEDIPSTSTGDRAHAVMLPRDHPPGRGQKKSAKRPRNERTTDNDGGEGNATTNTREGESEGILVSADEELSNIPWHTANFNLTFGENRAIRELKNMKEFVIKPTDKGGNVVVWPTGFRKDIITNNMLEGLTTKFLVVPTFYLMPK